MGIFDIDKIRADFPILQTTVYDKPLVYLDNAATTHKPQVVIDAKLGFYARLNSNIHRGVHLLSQKATDEFEKTRTKVRKFINASSEKEIIFTKGTTDAINLVAASFGRKNIGAGDEIIISTMEHHSNIVPWQLLCEEKGAILRVIPISDEGEILFEEFEKLLNERVKFVSVVHVSNALGTINPVKKIIAKAREVGAKVLLDGAQAIQHLAVDVQDLDCDFYAFSGHKLYAPTGVGVLFGKREILEKMPPYQGGGDMIRSVSFEKTTYNELPYKFEAGTPNIAGVIGLGAAIDYVEKIGIKAIADYENELLEYGTAAVSAIDGVKIIGTAQKKASVISFVVADVHPHGVGTILDREGVAIRAGHHCVQPLMRRFGIPATARASFSFYNTKAEIDALVLALKKTIEIFK